MGERRTAETTRQELAALMVGQDVRMPQPRPASPGAPLLGFENVSTGQRPGGSRLRNVSLELRAGAITGLAGVSGNGQGAIAALIAGTERPESGRILVSGKVIGDWSPRAALSAGIARIPEDRHAVGSIADMSVAENVVSERYREKPFSRNGVMDWARAQDFANRLIADYDVKCPSPDTRIRLLSGGNMQKLILGRALDPDPIIILANQPTRGLDVGAVAYVHGKLLEARDRGAAILLISEDLDEVLALSDTVIVAYQGEVSRPSGRGERTVTELGELMAGHGIGEGA